MKHLLFAIAFIAASFPTFAAEKESAYERVMRTGVIKCGYGISPPLLNKDPNTGVLSGMDYDVWETVARHLDLKIEWVESSGWGTFTEDLKTGRYDAFCTQLWISPPRMKYLSLSVPVAYSFVDAYVRSDDTRFDKDIRAANAETVTIPVVDGDVTEYMAKSTFPNAKRLSLPNSSSWEELHMSVTGKKADIFFIDPASYEALNKSNPVKLKKLKTPPVFSFASYYGFAKGEYGLRDTVDVALQMMIDSGQMEQMVKAASPLITPPARNYDEKKGR